MLVHSEHNTEEEMHDIVIYKLRSVPEIEIFCNRDALLHIMGSRMWLDELSCERFFQARVFV